ncbi:hypothetical protein [Sphingobium boeckii]|uniref:Uncharacterized protein n=1 Tax=Sphingobium boeckii TaxID=1082345 RepID=A0A7W9AH73_9SPHN|nr:hypothetical protein [Sphingobium boeckii]MBB5685452.1 hypothetical protein [Sphingobium boeckii]
MQRVDVKAEASSQPKGIFWHEQAGDVYIGALRHRIAVVFALTALTASDLAYD